LKELQGVGAFLWGIEMNINIKTGNPERKAPFRYSG